MNKKQKDEPVAIANYYLEASAKEGLQKFARKKGVSASKVVSLLIKELLDTLNDEEEDFLKYLRG